VSFLINFKLAKRKTMKRILIILFVLTDLICRSQAQISMSKAYSIMPNDTVNFGDSVKIFVFIKNTGNSVFSGFINVQAKRDTTLGASCGSSTVIASGFQPGDSIPTVITFTPTIGPTGFKVAGNGNTIVVWPIVTGALPGDSVRPILWIRDVNSVKEFSEIPFQLYPNPVTSQIHIKTTKQNRPDKLIVYDVFARKVKELSFNESIEVSDLLPGTYWLLISTDTKEYRIPFIKK
jgi:hypothetical protein